MILKRTIRLLLATFVAVFVGACGDQGPVPAAGTFAVTVVSPNGAEGAAVVVLVGEGLREASAVEGRVFSDRRGDTLRVVVAQEPAGTLQFLIAVDDTTQRPTGSVLEVAGPDDQLRPALAGYVLEVR